MTPEDRIVLACARQAFGPPQQALIGALVRRRVHGANFGLRERAAQGDMVHVLKATLDRRRGRVPGEGVR